jgi:hypothetical protein
MENFYIHTKTQDKIEFVAHFKDIKYFIIHKENLDNKLYTPYTEAGGLFTMTEKEGGEEMYQKWVEYKNK